MPSAQPELQGSTFVTGKGKAATPLLDFLVAIRPHAELMLRSFELAPSEAEELLSSTLQILVWRWETVRDRETYLLAILERRCQTFVEARAEARRR